MNQRRDLARNTGVLAALLLIAARGAAAAEASSVPRDDTAPTPVEETNTAETPLQRELRARDKAQSSAALRGYSSRSQSFISDPIDVPNSGPVVVLTRRDQPYTMTEVMALFPSAATALPDESILLTLPVLAGPGATLVVDSATTPRLLLGSTPTGYATLTTIEGQLQLTGTPQQPLTVTSAVDATGEPDAEIADGRAYISAQGGKMDIVHTNVSNLGFLLGETSGVSWMARKDVPATGSARDSTFRGNYFGAYSSGADGLLLSRVEFTDNLIYGFDPHSGTTNTVVEWSLATRNGRHGFIFSKDCHDNIIRDSTSMANGGAGFVIDDGNDSDENSPAPSHDNVLQRVSATDNADTGVVIEGGRGNIVQQAQIVGNPVGVWVKNSATATQILDTTITTAEQSAVRLNADTAGTTVADTTISDVSVGIVVDAAEGTTLADVTITDASEAAITTTSAPEAWSARNVAISGTGEAAVLIPGSAAAVDDLPGIDARGWSQRPEDALATTDWTFWVKLAPWLFILVVPMMLWIPIRWRWRRRQAARFGPRR